MTEQEVQEAAVAAVKLCATRNETDISEALLHVLAGRDEARKALAVANANHEKFERLWYLGQDEVDTLRAALAEACAALPALAGDPNKVKAWLALASGKAGA